MGKEVISGDGLFYATCDNQLSFSRVKDRVIFVGRKVVNNVSHVQIEQPNLTEFFEVQQNKSTIASDFDFVDNLGKFDCQFSTGDLRRNNTTQLFRVLAFDCDRKLKQANKKDRCQNRKFELRFQFSLRHGRLAATINWKNRLSVIRSPWLS